MDKKTLREYVIKQRNMLGEEERLEYSHLILKKISCLNSFIKADTIMCFSSFGSEVGTWEINKSILDSGKSLVLPRVELSGNKKVLGLYKVEDTEHQLVKGVFSIMEPNPAECEKVSVDIIDLFICPGVVFDMNCNRIGYGGGFYDRLLSTIENKCEKVGVGFEVQIVEKILPDLFDVPVDRVITEKRDIIRK